MPRALISNVRSLATADSPLLPFLAPQVLVEPVRSGTRKYHTRRCLHEAEDKEAAAHVQNIGCSRSTGAMREPQTLSSFSPRHLSRPAVATPSSSGLRYADIYAFARTQLARYSTAPDLEGKSTESADPGTDEVLADDMPLKNDHQSTSRSRTNREKRLKRLGIKHEPRDVPKNVKKPGPHEPRDVPKKVKKPKWDLKRSKSVPLSQQFTRVAILQVKGIHPMKHLPKGPTSFDRRRRQTLRLELSRLKIFKHHYPFKNHYPTGESRLMMLQGRYRALLRRIFALTRVEPTVLDLTNKHGHMSDSLQIQAFAALDRLVYAGRVQKASLEIKIKHDPRTEELASTICEGVDVLGEEQMLTNWNDCPESQRRDSWEILLLYLLERRPNHALMFIRMLAEQPHVKSLSPSVLADALEHIARACTKAQPDSPSPSDFLPIFTFAFSTILGRFRRICHQDLLLNVASLARREDLREIFDLLVEKRAYIGYDTLLHYANMFGKTGDHEYALRCLQRVFVDVAGRNSTIPSSKKFIWSCALILRKSMKDGQNYHSTTEIVAEFLKLNVKLDILLYNVIMHNAMDAGDYTTAFRVYNVLGENGVQADEYTYSILLHGCTTTSNPGMFQDFAEHCVKMVKELKDPWLATDYLYYLYVRHHEDEPHRLSAFLRHAYSQFFVLEPLHPILPRSVASTESENRQEIKSLGLTPPKVAIYIMLQTEISKALSAGPKQVWELYMRFLGVVQEGNNPIISDLATDPIIWNAFLYAFCKQQHFGNASLLIKNMTDGTPTNTPQPNVYSWNIFMQAFFKNEQVRAAERIYEIMRSRGVEPDQYTFQVMLRGYAKAQHIDKIGEVMGHIDNEQQLDPEILQTLTRINDRKRLMVVLENARLEKERKEKERAEKEEEEKRNRRPLFGSMLGKPRLVLGAQAMPKLALSSGSLSTGAAQVMKPASSAVQEASQSPSPTYSPSKPVSAPGEQVKAQAFIPAAGYSPQQQGFGVKPKEGKNRYARILQQEREKRGK